MSNTPKLSVSRNKGNGVVARIFFLDLGAGRVLSANPDGSDLQTLVSEGRKLPDGLAVDVAAGNLYWCDREGMRVMRANLDGSKIETLVDTSQGDPRPGADPIKWCVGIAVDADAGKLYWSQKGGDNAGEGSILRANLDIPRGQTPTDRADIELLYDKLPEPIDLDLDPGSRLLYWTDRGDPPRGNTVNRAPVEAPRGERPVPEIVFTHLMEGIGLALDPKHGRMFITDFGGSVYSANLDGSDPKTLLIAEGNLTGIAYAELPAT